MHEIAEWPNLISHFIFKSYKNLKSAFSLSSKNDLFVERTPDEIYLQAQHIKSASRLT
jgi:hypothetical protein